MSRKSSKPFIESSEFHEIIASVCAKKIAVKQAVADLEQRIGVKVSATTIRKYAKRKVEESGDDGQSSCCETSKLNLSKNLRSTMLSVDENGGVRQYNFHRYSKKTSTISFFRCTSCRILKQKGLCAKVPIIKVVNQSIVGNAHPEHAPDCNLIKKENVLATIEDREARLRTRQGLQAPRAAYDEAFKRCSSNEEGKKVEMYLRNWSEVKRSFYHHRSRALPTIPDNPCHIPLGQREDNEKVSPEFRKRVMG